MRLFVPEQFIWLSPVDTDRWAGDLKVADQILRVEAYAIDSTDPTTASLAGDLEMLAECGSPLQTIKIDNRDCYLVAMPKGN